jgi:hypothetical protein
MKEQMSKVTKKKRATQKGEGKKKTKQAMRKRKRKPMEF